MGAEAAGGPRGGEMSEQEHKPLSDLEATEILLEGAEGALLKWRQRAEVAEALVGAFREAVGVDPACRKCEGSGGVWLGLASSCEHWEPCQCWRLARELAVVTVAEQWRQARDAYATAHDSDREEGEWRDAMTRAHKELERAEDRLRQALDMAKEAGK